MAVSYTHLDVYKRQPGERLEIRASDPILFADAYCLQAPGADVIADGPGMQSEEFGHLFYGVQFERHTGQNVESGR